MPAATLADRLDDHASLGPNANSDAVPGTNARGFAYCLRQGDLPFYGNRGGHDRMSNTNVKIVILVTHAVNPMRIAASLASR